MVRVPEDEKVNVIGEGREDHERDPEPYLPG
jgi:hypothetical protein